MRTPVRLLALDLATKTGWALQENGQIESGVEDFAPIRHESAGMRWLKFRRWIDWIAGERWTPELIIFERWVATRTGVASEITAGFTTRMVEFCDERKIEYVAISPSELKKWVTGRGNASKHDMLEAVARRWRRVDDDNEADALALLHYAIEVVLPHA
jgi:crossover junction endodeoxyribonuclease RuvC